MSMARTGDRDTQPRWLIGALTLLTTLLIALGAAGGAGATTLGALDTSFGSHGIASGPGNTSFAGVAALTDGSVLAVGQSSPGSSPGLIVAKFNPNGGLDGSFGSGGVAHGSSSAGSTIGRAIAVQPNGDIVVVGSATDSSGQYRHGIVIERFTPGGQLDTSFGSGGLTEVLGSSFGDGYAVGLQSNGKILAAGSADAMGSGGSSFPRLAVARLNSNGSPDGSFGSGGTSVIDTGPYSYALSLAVQSDGKIVVAGSQAPDLQVPNALVARLTSSGGLDGSFASGGVYAHQYAQGAASSAFNAVGVEPNGQVVAAGTASVGNSGANTIVARFSSGGAPDGSFGSGGVAETTSAVGYTASAGSNVPGANALALGPGGEVILGGFYSNDNENAGAVWAFGSNGHGLGSGGQSLVSMVSVAAGAQLTGVALSPDGNYIVAAGQSGPQGATAPTGIVTRMFAKNSSAPPPPPGKGFKLTLSGVAGSYKLASISKGLKLKATCSTGCQLHAALTVNGSTAKKLGLASTVLKCKTSHGHKKCTATKVFKTFTVATASGRLSKAGSKTLTLHISGKALGAIKKQKQVKLTLQLVGKAGSSKKTINKTITVKH